MTDILGPSQSVPNAVTTRPVDSRSFGAADTWFKDCTSAVASDGTDLVAAFFNEMVANLRAVARINGSTAGAVPVVTEDNADAMIARAVQHLVQRGRTNYAVDTSGAANTVAVTLNPVPAEMVTGMRLLVRIANANTGAVAFSVNTFSGMAITYRDGSALVLNEFAVGSFADLIYTGASWILQNAKNTLSFNAAVVPRLYTASGTWSKPAGLVAIKARFAGSGGSGGISGSASDNTERSHGGAGGSGGVVEAWFAAGELSATEAFTIGAAPAVRPTASGAGVGTAGSSSIFKGLTAGGGQAGGGSATSSSPGGTGGVCSVSGNAAALNGVEGGRGATAGIATPLGPYGSSGGGGFIYEFGSNVGSAPGPGVLIIEEYYR